MEPAVENPLDPAKLHDRFGDLHDSSVTRVEVRYTEQMRYTAVVEMETPDRTKGEFQVEGESGWRWHWVKLTFDLAGVSEFRVSQRFNTFGFGVFEARLACLEDDWWLCLDDTPFNPAEAATVDKARESDFYLRCTDIGIRWSAMSRTDGAQPNDAEEA